MEVKFSIDDRKGKNNPMYGRKHSKETKQKMSKRRMLSPNNWKGGRINRLGYIGLKKPNHPCSSTQGYILEHRYIASIVLGRCLKRGETVHHINGNKADNRNSNLLICTNSYHGYLESRMADLYKKKIFNG